MHSLSRITIIGLLAVLAPRAYGQDAIPAPVRAAIEESRKQCDEKFTTGRGFLTRRISTATVWPISF
jgi:hypothetical protein